VELLLSNKHFDPDVEVSFHYFLLAVSVVYDQITHSFPQDGSGWTPLMIAASLKNAEGDPIIDMLLKKGADVNVKSNSGQVRQQPSQLDMI
jgi:26S proteasome non-ATPase regulatory subunit 10